MTSALIPLHILDPNHDAKIRAIIERGWEKKEQKKTEDLVMFA